MLLVRTALISNDSWEDAEHYYYRTVVCFAYMFMCPIVIAPEQYGHLSQMAIVDSSDGIHSHIYRHY